LNLNRPREVELLGFGLGRFVPLLEDLGKGCPVDLDELLKLIEVITKLLEAFLERGELGGQPRDALVAGLEDLLLVQ
jgi:hypothetical protein